MKKFWDNLECVVVFSVLNKLVDSKYIVDEYPISYIILDNNKVNELGFIPLVCKYSSSFSANFKQVFKN